MSGGLNSEADSAWSILLYVIGSLVCIFALCFTVLLIYALKKHHIKGMHTATYPTTIAAAVFYFISSVILLVAVPQVHFEKDSNLQDDKELVFLTLFFVFFLIMARLSIDTQFVVRLYVTFKTAGDDFAVKRRTLIIIIAMIAIVLITAIWWTILLLLRYIVYNREFTGYNEQLVAVTVIILLFDSSASWLVVSTMTDKLLQTIDLKDRSDVCFKMENLGGSPRIEKLQNSKRVRVPSTMSEIAETHKIPQTPTDADGIAIGTLETPTGRGGGGIQSDSDIANTPTPRETTNIRSMSNISNVSRMSNASQREAMDFAHDLAYSCFTEEDKRRLSLVTKLFVLSILSIITSQICYLSMVIAVIYRIIAGSNNFNQSLFLMIVLGFYYPLEVGFNFISLYLTNKFALQWYESLCRPCHSCCNGCLQRAAVRRVVHGRHKETFYGVGDRLTTVTV